MKKGKFTKKKEEKELISFYLIKELLNVYLLAVFVAYPLYYEDNYYNMSEAKWGFFRKITYYVGDGLPVPTFLVLLCALFIWYQRDLYVHKKLETFWKEKVTLTDKFVLFYFGAALISTILSPYKKYVVWGYEGWYMGIIAQFTFCALYFFVSRFWRWNYRALALYLLISAAVNVLGILNRFSIDPLGMYEGLEYKYILEFLSTLGQRTWYSSYVMVLFPIGLFIYWHTEDMKIRIASMIYVIACSMSMIVQGADSALFALFATLLTLFCFSFRENRYMLRFLEIVIIMLMSWRVIGLLQINFPDYAVPIGELMLFGSQSPVMWVPIVAFLLLYIYLYRYGKAGIVDVKKLKLIRTIALFITVAGLMLSVLYIVLNTLGALPDSLISNNMYLYFDDSWGNNRGLNWRLAVQSLGDALFNDPLRFLIGAGPDEYVDMVFFPHYQEYAARYGETIAFVCAHNEWLNQIINTGIIGGAAYIGIFASSFIFFIKKSADIPELVAPALCIAAYFAHDFFCYQQIISTPLIFIIMGAGISIVRTGELRAIHLEN